MGEMMVQVKKARMLSVRKDLCTGCGACTAVCPTGAISLDGGTARIDQSRCIGCQACARACPKGAIRAKEVPVSATSNLRDDLVHLQAEVQNLTRRLEALERKRKGK